MDLFLMDFILKGMIPEQGSVLDLGCGGGRNATYFIRGGYRYVGIDADESQIQLCNFIVQNFKDANAEFFTSKIQSLEIGKNFDMIICSRVLHFAENEEDFDSMWRSITRHLAPGGTIYIAMDSTINTTLGKQQGQGLVEFPDGKIRFALTERLYDKIKQGLLEVEPLKSVIYHGERAQSFVLLKAVN